MDIQYKKKKTKKQEESRRGREAQKNWKIKNNQQNDNSRKLP